MRLTHSLSTGNHCQVALKFRKENPPERTKSGGGRFFSPSEGLHDPFETT
jgi:hypothetical protein